MDVDSNGFDIIKSFISTVKEYNNQRSEAVSQKLQRYLQILSTISDSNVFDPNNADGAEFYVSLHDVMSTLDSRTGLMWCAVSVLEEACKNPAAQHALIHTYKFTPILAQLLSGHLIHDKQLKVLRLLQEFTYGVKILWQEAHLPLLISILTKWIKDSDRSPEIVTLSLGVLVNLCYKNLPAVYTLRRVIDIKDFMNSVLSQRKDILDIRVQAYKMTIILEEVSGEVSDTEILACVTWTFKRMHEAFENGSVNAMRHLVDLFKDIKENDNLKSVLLKYPSYSSDTNKLLQLLENKIGDAFERHECVVLLLEFVQSVISLCPSEMESFYEPLVKLSLTINGINAQISQIALQVICTLMVETRKQGKNINPSVITILETALPELCTLNIQDVKVSDRNATTALLGLLLELSQESTMGKRILSSLQPQVVKNYFLEMLSSDSQENDNLFDETSTAFYLQALSLVSTLSLLEEQWKLLFSELLQHKKVKVRLAAALYTGSAQVKLEVLQLISQLGCDSRLLAELSQCMAELDKLMSPAASNSSNGFCIQQNLSTLTGHRSSPLLSQAQYNRLDQCITTVQQAIAKNELGTVGTAAVLELYEYRVAAMSHTESVLQGNLQAVDTYCTQLRHRLSVMSTKVNKLLSVLHDKEQNLEVCKKTNNKLQHDLTEVKAVQDKYSQELEMNNTKIEELTKELTIVNKKFKELQELEITYKKELELQREKISTMEGEILNLENVVGDKEERIKQKCKELKEATSIIQNREMKIEQQEALIKALEKVVCEKDNEISQQQSEIAELENMRNVIMKLTLEKNQGKKK